MGTSLEHADTATDERIGGGPVPGFHAFPTRLPYGPASGQEDPDTIVDRFSTPDLEYRNDGRVDSINRTVEP
ncbi:hypothetical protein [Microbispora sp. GKU 823]|uniref:hypothetical protein n=1 Tax=Microbispora sp. GKU 823 TaxID=1652100 RepID=UPI00117DF307|nr:hypothetical protein [Microbispora sp. GKU 823]